LLHILSVICKPTGRVKVGKRVFKPSEEEAREAFIQTVAVNIFFLFAYYCPIILLFLFSYCKLIIFGLLDWW